MTRTADAMCARVPPRGRDVQTVRQFIDAMDRRRVLIAVRLTSPAMALRIPATTPLLRRQEHRPRWRAALFMARVYWLSRGTLHLHPRSIEPDGDGVLAVVRLIVSRRGRQFDGTLYMHFTVTQGRIRRLVETAEPLEQWRDFWS